jgi:hypothetical protein
MSSIRAALAAQRWTLKHAFQCAIDAAVARILQACPNPTEPDFVYGIFQSAIEDMDRELKRALQGTQFSAAVSGIFCHQSPYVTLCSPAQNQKSRCEIGDLLVTVRCNRHRSPSTNRAMLLQFKRQDSPSGNREFTTPQFALYNKWTPFNYDAQYMCDCGAPATGAPCGRGCCVTWSGRAGSGSPDRTPWAGSRAISCSGVRRWTKPRPRPAAEAAPCGRRKCPAASGRRTSSLSAPWGGRSRKIKVSSRPAAWNAGPG